MTLPTDSHERKQYPIITGVLDYFPDAIAEVAYVSWVGNEKHNPGEPLHWARGKSMDQEDCIGRHTIERDGFETVVLPDGRTFRIRHLAARAWRALAALQLQCEADGAPMSRGSQE
ncbi:MAG: dATP/dGTP diphosphohydrolase domain-containing protein [Gammaproteobacteria bacterium]